MANNKETRARKLGSNSVANYGIVDAVEVSGHKSVASRSSLYTLSDAILSTDPDDSAANGAALGQEWYVRSEKKYYRLVDWSKRKTSDGWVSYDILDQLERADAFRFVGVLGYDDAHTKDEAHYDLELGEIHGPSIDGTSNPNSYRCLPTLNNARVSAGVVYKVGVEGTYAGQKCEVGDMVICVKDYTIDYTGLSTREEKIDKYHNAEYWLVVQANLDGKRLQELITECEQNFKDSATMKQKLNGIAANATADSAIPTATLNAILV